MNGVSTSDLAASNSYRGRRAGWHVNVVSQSVQVQQLRHWLSSFVNKVRRSLADYVATNAQRSAFDTCKRLVRHIQLTSYAHKGVFMHVAGGFSPAQLGGCVRSEIL